MRAKNFLPTLTVILILLSVFPKISLAAITFVSLSPANLVAKVTDQPSFTFTAQSNKDSTFSCTLWIDNNPYGTNSSVANNTATTIQANDTLSPGSHEWWINCTDSDGEYKSSVYTIYTGGEIDNCAKLVDSYGHYVLTADIINSSTSPCIDIQANNIVLDCQNHLVDGDDNADYGIYIPGHYNVTVKKCRVSDWDGANIFLENANGNTLENITTYSSPDYGIWLYSSDSNTLSNITTYWNNHGIWLYYSDSNTLSNITTYWNNYGIWLYSSGSNTLSNIITYSNNNHGIWLYFSSNSNTLSSITAHSNNGDGICLHHYSSTNTIKNSKIYGNSNYGIYLEDAGRSGANLIYNNLFNNSANVGFGGTIYSNSWNTTKQKGSNVYYPSYYPYVGGNFWAKPTGEGYSQTCEDNDKDGFCDRPYDVTTDSACTPGVNCSDNVDYLPLSDEWLPRVNLTLSVNSTVVEYGEGVEVYGRAIELTGGEPWSEDVLVKVDGKKVCRTEADESGYYRCEYKAPREIKNLFFKAYALNQTDGIVGESEAVKVKVTFSYGPQKIPKKGVATITILKILWDLSGKIHLVKLLLKIWV